MARSIFFAIGTFISVVAYTQKVRNGPRFGLAISTRTAGQFMQWNGLPKLGPLVGWSFDIPYTKQIGFRVEPMLMSKGSWTRNDLLDQNTRITDRYIEVPVLLRLDLDTTAGGFFLNGGGIFGYWMSNHTVITDRGSVSYDRKGDLSASNVRRTEWSLAIGLGQQGKKWSWEVRGQTSVTPFDRLVRSQNLAFALHITYWLPQPKPKKSKTEEEEEDVP